MTKPNERDYLWENIKDLPYFRGLLRAVEARFYRDIELPSPVLDLGCGDGHFASMAFDEPLDYGVDPWWGQIKEAQTRKVYRHLIHSAGAELPFPDGYFASVVSNSVLEHIPELDAVIAEVSRVAAPGAPFIFCVPNHRFLDTLSVSNFFDRAGLKPLGNSYRAFFNRISRHHHCDDPDAWEARLNANGFELDRHWHYFSPAAFHALEWGHYLGLPSWLTKMTLGRWILSPTRWNLKFTYRYLARFYNEPPEQQDGVYTFYIAHKTT